MEDLVRELTVRLRTWEEDGVVPLHQDHLDALLDSLGLSDPDVVGLGPAYVQEPQDGTLPRGAGDRSRTVVADLSALGPADADLRCAAHQLPLMAASTRRDGEPQVVAGCRECLGPEESWVAGWRRLL